MNDMSSISQINSRVRDMREFMKRRWMLVALMAIVCCMVLIAGISIPKEVAYAADESGETTEVTKENAAASVTRDSSVTYYKDIFDAVANLADGDTIKLLNDIDIPYERGDAPEITKNVTLDLNGKSVDGSYGAIRIISEVRVVDTSESGGYCYFNIAGTSSSAAANVTIDANPNTRIGISYYNGSIKVYVGKIVKYTRGNAPDNLTELLPEGYCFVCTYRDGTKERLTWAECLENAGGKVEKESNGNYLTAEECKHTSYDADLTCNYCHSAISAGEAINKANEDLAKAKDELQKAIDNKADVATLNEKVAKLTDAIANAQKVSADQDDALEKQIKDAQNTAIESAKDTLDIAKSELTAAIETKADANKVNEAIEGLRTAIVNAQAVNNAYVDENNQALKAELEGKIAQAEEEISAAIAKLSERLDAVESKTATLQTMLIVFIVLLSLANIATVVMFVLRRRK